MTKEQQKIIDGFHTRVISLMLKRARAQRYGTWAEEEALTKEIEKIEDERKTYERQQKPPRPKEPEIEGSVPETTTGNELKETETEIL